MKALFSLLLLLPIFAGAQEVVDVSAVVTPDHAVPGGEIALTLKVRVPSGFHIYGVQPPDMTGIPSTIELEDSVAFVPKGMLIEPKPKFHFDEIFKVDVPWHNGEVVFSLPLMVSEDLAPGTYSVNGAFGYQLCDERSCRIPDEVAFSTEVTVEGEGEAAVEKPASGSITPAITLDLTGELPGDGEESSDSEAGAPGLKVIAKFVGYDPSEEKFLKFLRGEGDRQPAARSKGLWAFIGGAIAAGFLSIFTPCVFPMIPITVSFFSRMAGGSRKESAALAATYSAGIIFTYTAIGILFSVLLGASGIQNIATSPVMNLVLAAVLIFFTLNLLGLFEIRISTGGMGARQREGKWGKIVSVLLMALAFTIASFTCTAGFVGALLIAASQGEVFWPLVGMLAYSMAFALPFFFLALFPSWLASMPQSGGWMNRIKVTMGILILVASFKFLSNADTVLGLGLLSRDGVLAIWVAAFALLGFYLLGKIRLPHDDPEPTPVGVPRFLVALAVFALSIHLVFGIAGKDVWGPVNGLLPAPHHGKELAGEEWSEDYDEAVAEARREAKLLFIDFTGYTCTNCKLMEHKVLSKPAVVAELKKFVRVRLYTDGGPDKKRNQELAKELADNLALPLYVIVDPGRVLTFSSM